MLVYKYARSSTFLIVGTTIEIIGNIIIIGLVAFIVSIFSKKQMRKIHEIKLLPYESKYKLVESYLQAIKNSNTFGKYCFDLFQSSQFPPVALLDYFIEIIDLAIGAGQQYKRSIHQSTFKDLDDIYS